MSRVLDALLHRYVRFAPVWLRSRLLARPTLTVQTLRRVSLLTWKPIFIVVPSLFTFTALKRVAIRDKFLSAPTLSYFFFARLHLCTLRKFSKSLQSIVSKLCFHLRFSIPARHHGV